MCTYIYLIGLSILMCQIKAAGLLYVYLYIPDRLIYINVPNYSGETVVCVLQHN